jgi:nucleoside-diphosphate-sugar epimerase
VPQKTVLVVGGSGLVGSAAMRHFLAVGCETIVISRRKPPGSEGANFLSLDLTDATRCEEILSALPRVTHLVYAALHEKEGLVAGWSDDEQIRINDRMLRNVLTPLERVAGNLRHVTILQGTKAYGAHVGPIDVPAREGRSELLTQPNFYWNQQAFLKETQQGKNWSWTIFRPQLIVGETSGGAMNLIAAIGAYGAVLKAQGDPLFYPGPQESLREATDVDLLARAIAWAGEAPTASNQTFNITNGDVYGWKNVWPAIADALGIEVGERRSQKLAEVVPPEAALWDELRARYSLVSPPLMEFVGGSLQFVDFCMRECPPVLVSSIKLRQAGFHEVIDTEDMFRKWFRVYQDKRYLPPA